LLNASHYQMLKARGRMISQIGMPRLDWQRLMTPNSVMPSADCVGSNRYTVTSL
jgi:hypothetical protein